MIKLFRPIKIKTVILLILLFTCSSIFGMGIGPQLEFTHGFDDKQNIVSAGASCSMKADNFPAVLTVCTDYDFARNKFTAYTTFDYWIFEKNISDYCSLFFGPGVSIGCEINRTRIDFCSGPRFVSGFSWIFYDGFMEYFIQCAVQPEYSTNKSIVSVKIPLNTGMRFYF